MVDEPETVITNPRWNVSGQAGCCGIGTVFRLGARDWTLSQRDAAKAAWYEMTNPKAIGSDLNNWTERTLKQILHATNGRPNGSPYASRRISGDGAGSPNWPGAAIPANLAFSAVIEAMLSLRFAIYILSDNMTTQGDVHTGSFSTKNFVRWLILNEVGQFQATGPIESLRTRRDIQGWLFTPNWKQMERLCGTGRSAILTYFKELNNDKRIKSPEQDRIRARAADQATLVTGFTNPVNWGDTS